MSLARRRLRQIVGDLVVDRGDPTLARHLSRSADEGFGVNVNLLGESVLGEREARRRLAATIDLLERPDVSYVSVKASAVTSQLNLWAYEDSLARVTNGLRPILRAAAAHTPAKFVNLDMEEYKDLRLTVDAFTALLDEPELHSIEAGIVLQAYLPDSFDALVHLVGWATERRRRGGAGIKVRVVKGANLAMEKVDAAMHGWTQAPFDTKASTDANYKRMLDWAMQPDRVAAARIGVASHNLFDVAWAKLLADVRGVNDRVEFEMLQGMAPGEARTVRDATGALLLYTPVVAADDFDTALAYLFRRLEENSSGDNFLRHAFDLAGDAAAFASEQARFELAVADRWAVSSAPRRRNAAPGRGSSGFANQPDTDPLDDGERSRIIAALASPPMPDLPAEVTAVGIDEIVGRARRGAARWRAVDPAERRAVLLRVGDELQGRRVELVAVMADEAAKTVGEGDTEVSEAVDFARYYAEHLPELDRARGDGAEFEPFGVCAVIPPWNFPVAIPAGGVVAALAAGNSVVLKPAPETPRCAAVLAEACWAAGVPEDVLQFVRCPDDEVGEHLVSHVDVDATILTGAYETAELFARLAPGTALFAETSGKNAIVVMPDADLDLAVADLVRSAFGHGGQKCSAASLAICVGDVARSERFRRQLVDATQSLVVAPSVRPEATMGPLIGEPSAKLRRALTVLEPGQRWLLVPRLLDDDEHLWTAGILEGVESGSWFHRNECFGPVLGLMYAPDLDRAVELQNEVAFGLTGGIHTLDEANVEHWLARVQVGNAYVNRAITGAIVQRQPFGGWKRSIVGPGAKAGGPNYVAQLGRWTDAADPDLGQDPSPRIEALVASLSSALDESGRDRLPRRGPKRRALVARRVQRRARSDGPVLRGERVPVPAVAGGGRAHRSCGGAGRRGPGVGRRGADRVARRPQHRSLLSRFCRGSRAPTRGDRRVCAPCRSRASGACPGPRRRAVRRWRPHRGDPFRRQPGRRQRPDRTGSFPAGAVDQPHAAPVRQYRARPLEVMRSHQRQASVDDQRVAGDVRRVAGQEEHGRRGDVPRRALSPERHRRPGVRWPTLGGDSAHRGVDESGCDHVRPDSAASALQGDVTAEPDQPRLRGVVGRKSAARQKAGDGTDEDDRPALAQDGDCRLGQEERAAEVDRQGRVPVLDRGVAKPHAQPDAGVAHHPGESVRRRHHRRAVGFRAHVADHDRCRPAFVGHESRRLCSRRPRRGRRRRRGRPRGDRDGDRPSVADRSVGIGAGPGSGADHQDRPAVEPAGHSATASGSGPGDVASKPSTPSSIATPSEFNVPDTRM